MALPCSGPGSNSLKVLFAYGSKHSWGGGGLRRRIALRPCGFCLEAPGSTFDPEHKPGSRKSGAWHFYSRPRVRQSRAQGQQKTCAVDPVNGAAPNLSPPYGNRALGFEFCHRRTSSSSCHKDTLLSTNLAQNGKPCHSMLSVLRFYQLLFTPFWLSRGS